MEISEVVENGRKMWKLLLSDDELISIIGSTNTINFDLKEILVSCKDNMNEKEEKRIAHSVKILEELNLNFEKVAKRRNK